MNPLLQYWYFHVPNYLLAIAMYMALGRFVLSFFFPPDSTNVIFRAFVTLTEPVVRIVRVVTPILVPHMLVLLFSFFWVFVARIVFYMFMAANGLTPPLG